MNITKNPKNNTIIDFRDIDAQLCSIEESKYNKLATIWLGRDGYRMYLDQELVKKLIPFLEKFVESGYLE